jgi:membrane protease YdiL (CAAX protease family)
MSEQLANDPWIQAVVAIQLVAGLAPWFYIMACWRREGGLLPYEPRRPVPWGPAGAMLALAFTAITISSALASDHGAQQAEAPTTQQVLFSLVASMVMQLCGPALLVFIATLSNAKRSDIGLPPFSAGAIARDISIGIVACLAALLPVRLVQIGVTYVLKLPNELTKHPLVEMLTESEPEIAVLVVATVMAVVVAPIGEEITFRLLLQGWLEKWEDRRLGWRNRLIAEALPAEVGATTVAADTQLDDAEVEAVELAPVETAPPQRGVAGLPYGWAPIIMSSLLFAAAHFGYGPEPAPLFVLALILGYCYQRTHRILPCIVAHALFNLMSMMLLWRVVFLGEG